MCTCKIYADNHTQPHSRGCPSRGGTPVLPSARAYVTRLLRKGAAVSVRLSPYQRTWYTEPVWRDDQAEQIEVGQRAANWDDWDMTLWKYTP